MSEEKTSVYAHRPDAMLKALVSDVPPFRWVNESRANFLIQQTPLVDLLKSGVPCLDVGAGSSFISSTLQKNSEGKITSIDLFDLPSTRNRKVLQDRFAVTDAVHLPFKTDSFGLSYAISVLHHLPSRDHQIQALKEMKRVSKFVCVMEDLVENEENRKKQLFADRAVNLEFFTDNPHIYRSDVEWKNLFGEVGFTLSESRIFDSKFLGFIFHHGFYVLETSNQELSLNHIFN